LGTLGGEFSLLRVESFDFEGDLLKELLLLRKRCLIRFLKLLGL